MSSRVWRRHAVRALTASLVAPSTVPTPVPANSPNGVARDAIRVTYLISGTFGGVAPRVRRVGQPAVDRPIEIGRGDEDGLANGWRANERLEPLAQPRAIARPGVRQARGIVEGGRSLEVLAQPRQRVKGQERRAQNEKAGGLQGARDHRGRLADRRPSSSSVFISSQLPFERLPPDAELTGGAPLVALGVTQHETDVRVHGVAQAKRPGWRDRGVIGDRVLAGIRFEIGRGTTGPSLESRSRS